MESGLTDHVWTAEEVAGLLEALEDAKPRKRGPTKRGLQFQTESLPKTRHPGGAKGIGILLFGYPCSRYHVQMSEKADRRSPGDHSMFKVGDLVALRSEPSMLLPVIEVIPGGAECRYRVFQNNTRTTYYESQLQAAAVATDERKALSRGEIHVEFQWRAVAHGIHFFRSNRRGLAFQRRRRDKFGCKPLRHRAPLDGSQPDCGQ